MRIAKPMLSIVMATHEDFHGVFFSIQYLKMILSSELLKRIEIIVVDQAPKGRHAEQLTRFINSLGRVGFFGMRYVPYSERVGTSAGRNKAIEEASAPIVICMDCHVFPGIGAIEAVLKYFDNPDHSLHIYSGPILTDAVINPTTDGLREAVPDELTIPELFELLDTERNLSLGHPELAKEYSVLGTHFADHLRSQMWGTWATAWQCTCKGYNFATWESGQIVQYEDVDMRPQSHKRCPNCNKKFPLLGWSGHERGLTERGYTNLGSDGTEPFEIPGQGLGFFAVLKANWPGFNPDHWGFGGEELYIHEKYRSLGGMAVCDPRAVWMHRFHRPEPPTYPNTDWFKCRNYVLEFQESFMVERCWTLDFLRSHFVPSPVPPEEFEVMVTRGKELTFGPNEKYVEPQMVNGIVTNYYRPDIVELFDRIKATPRDLDQHMVIMRELATGYDHLTEFSKRREGMVAWVAAGALNIVSHNSEMDDQLMVQLKPLWEEKNISVTQDKKSSTVVESIEPTDVLFLDTVHHGDYLRGELAKYAGSVRHRILTRGTAAFGIEAEGGGPGIFEPLRDFVKMNPEWFVMYHSPNQYGFIALSRDPEDRPEKAIIPWPPGEGPGTELQKIYTSIGIVKKPNCDCTGKMIQMDLWGVEGCEANYDQIVTWMREGSVKWGWSGNLAVDVWKNPALALVGVRALLNGLAFKLDPQDPFPALVSEAIKRARALQIPPPNKP